MSDSEHSQHLANGKKLTENVLDPMKQAFVGKDEIIDLLGISLVARENLFVSEGLALRPSKRDRGHQRDRAVSGCTEIVDQRFVIPRIVGHHKERRAVEAIDQ